LLTDTQKHNAKALLKPCRACTHSV